MIQILILCLCSWLLLWLTEKRGLSVLGILPDRHLLPWIFACLLLSGGISALTYISKIYLAHERYIIHPALYKQPIWLNIAHECRSVFTEELLCRGALMYILIKKLGPNKAIWITACLFGLLHWLPSGVWGNVYAMTTVFISTGVMGLLLGYAYSCTRSIWMPTAIHVGWNITNHVIFPGNLSDASVFILSAPPPTVTISYLAFFTIFFCLKYSLSL